MDKKRILIMSDSHQRIENALRAIEQAGEIDLMIHAGDVGMDYLALSNACRVYNYIIQGNNDIYYPLPKHAIFQLGKYNVYVNHGHRLGVDYGTNSLEYKALEYGCNIAIYGHTHKPYFHKDDEMMVLNPGSITLPRQGDRKKTYMIMNIDDAGEAHVTLCYLDDPGANKVLC